MKKSLFILTLVLSFHAPMLQAAEGRAQGSASDADEATVTSLDAEEGTPGRLDAALELRPSWTLQEDRLHTENSAEVWYHFSRQRELRYIQYFNTNLLNAKGADEGLGFELQPGWLVYKLKKLWTNGRSGLVLDGEPTAIVPTWKTDREAGKIVELRNDIKLTKNFNDRFYVRLEEMPTLFAYSKPGALIDDEETANPILENRLYLVGGVNLTDKLTFELPIWIMATRYRNYQEGAKNNDSWGANVIIWPELDYTVDRNLMLGVSYYSDNLVAPDLSQFTWDSGFRKGAAQLILRASI